MIENYGEAAEALKGACEVLREIDTPVAYMLVAALQTVEDWIVSEFDN